MHYENWLFTDLLNIAHSKAPISMTCHVTITHCETILLETILFGILLLIIPAAYNSVYDNVLSFSFIL